jgi:4-aminobutyrate aminotransferase/(S)-3-amino-2-methylpropionate transaminase
MGPPAVTQRVSGVRAHVPSGTVVYHTAKGSNVLDVDGNRYVDLAAGFGALLLGHAHPAVLRVIELQASRLLQALGDVHPAEARIALAERLARLFPEAGARVIIGQSGADAVTAALKTAVLATGKPGIVAFRGAYHGLSYGPLALCGLRESYREPFAAQLNPRATFVDYPADESALDLALERARFELARGDVGAVLCEPVLGRGGCVVPPAGFLRELGELAHAQGALLIADEVWTGLGRSGKMLYSSADDGHPDLVCLGKGLGGGLPISACIGRDDVMAAWRRDAEVVHTSTFAGAPLAAATAITTLDVLSRERLAERAADVGGRFLEALRTRLEHLPGIAEVRGAGLMLGIDLGERPGAAVKVQQALLRKGWLVSTGGGRREVVVLTPPLNIAEPLLFSFADTLAGLPHLEP